jgi:hypothetical protein
VDVEDRVRFRADADDEGASALEFGGPREHVGPRLVGGGVDETWRSVGNKGDDAVLQLARANPSAWM